MKDIRYYPVVDCDTDGTEKMPMFSTTDPAARNNHTLYLEETIPHYYRLRARVGHRPTNAFRIRCPMCSRAMRCISGDINETKLGLYVCGSCNKT